MGALPQSRCPRNDVLDRRPEEKEGSLDLRRRFLRSTMNPHRSLFSQYPLVQHAVAFSTGVFAATYFPIRLGYSLCAGAVWAALLVILVLKKRVQVAGVALLFAMLVAGMVLADLERRSGNSNQIRGLVEQSENQTLTLTGWLDGPPEFARDRVYLSLRVEDVSGRVSLLVTLRDAAIANEFRALQLRYGTRISVSTTLDRTGNYLNPGVSSLAEFLDRNGYDATGLIKNPSAITRLDDTRVFPPLARLYDWRSRLQQQID